MPVIETIALMSAAAACAALAARLIPRLLIPALIFEIALGIGLGPYGLAMIPKDDPTMAVLAQIGFAILMLIAGLEIDLGKLFAVAPEDKSSRPIWLALAMSVLTVVIAVIGVWLTVGKLLPWTHAAIYAVVLSTTSVGIVVPTIQERGLADTAYGQALLSTALLADFTTMVAISVLAGIVAHGNASGASGSFALVGIAIVAILAIPKVQKVISTPRFESRTSLPLLRASIALLFLSAWLAVSLGAELMLSAFLVGLLLGRLVPRRHDHRRQIETIGYGLAVPFFFFSVGVKFDLGALAGSSTALALIPTLLLIAVANKLLPALLIAPRYGFRAALAAGALLSARLSLIIAAAEVATRIGVFDAATNAAMILLAITTAVAGPLGFNALTRRLDIESRADGH